MRISVLMPFRDAETTIDAALRSLLRQTHRDLEVLAIDDGSSDASGERVAAFARDDPRVRVLGDGRRRGLSARLNEGIDAASGEFLARMDADDAAHPDRLAAQCAALAADATLDLVGAAVVVVRGDEALGVRRFPREHASIMASAWRGVPIAHPCFMGRREWFRRHRYDESFARAQDQELLLRAAPSSRYGNLERPLLAYRESVGDAARRQSRRFRRAGVRRHRGAIAAAALALRDLLASRRSEHAPRGLEAIPELERSAWSTLARSGQWPDLDSRS